MATVRFLTEADDDLDGWSAREQVALRNAVLKLEALGLLLQYPHCSGVQGHPGWKELRPRSGRSPCRALYRRTGPDDFMIAAIAPDGQTDPGGFAGAVWEAQRRLAKWEEQREDTE